MHGIASSARQLISSLLHALGIRDRACDNLLVLGLGTFIIFGLLVIITLKIVLVRRAERTRAERAVQPASTTARRRWMVIRAVAWIGVLLAVSILIALRLNS